MYRTPTDSPREAEMFYNEQYDQGATTALPSLPELQALKENGFAGQETDYHAFASVLTQLGVEAGAKLFDFGSSWGYGSYIFDTEGFSVVAYEISRERGQYGRDNLGVDLVDDFDEYLAANEGTFDVFFTSHVLEHVPSPSSTITNGFRLLKPGGLLVSFFPNGSEARRRADPAEWQQLWGEVHPNLLDDVYLANTLAGIPYLLGTSPISIPPFVRDQLRSVDSTAIHLDDLKNYEFFVAARKRTS